MTAVRPEQITKILQLTDSLNIHREAVTIPLTTEKAGSFTVLPNEKLRIVCPEQPLFDEWLNDLKSQLEKMDLSRIIKH